MPTGALVEATLMDFKTIKEDWNSYELADGTVVKLKTTAVGIYRLETTDPVTGQHHYYVQHDTIVAAVETGKAKG